MTEEQRTLINKFAAGPLDSYDIHKAQPAVRALIDDYNELKAEFKQYKLTEHARFHSNAMQPATWEWETLQAAREIEHELRETVLPELIAAMQRGLERIKSDIEATDRTVPEGDALRAAIAIAESWLAQDSNGEG